MHPADLGAMHVVLVRYLGEWMGGPALYSAARGKPRLRKKHLPFAIGPSERDAWLAAMDAALADSVEDPQLRAELHQAFWAAAEFMRNDPAHVHTQHG